MTTNTPPPEVQVSGDLFGLLYGTYVDNFGDRGLNPDFRAEPDHNGETASFDEWATHDALNSGHELPGGDVLLGITEPVRRCLIANLPLYAEDYEAQSQMRFDIQTAIETLRNMAAPADPKDYDQALVDLTVRHITTGDEEETRLADYTSEEIAGLPAAVRDEIMWRLEAITYGPEHAERGHLAPGSAEALERIRELLLPYISDRELYESDYGTWEDYVLEGVYEQPAVDR